MESESRDGRRMKYWIIGDEFLDSEDKKSADAQGYLRELVCCKDCKHRPRQLVNDEHEGFNLEFPDEKCPCQCEDDPWYNWMPKDYWYCGNGERKEE